MQKICVIAVDRAKKDLANACKALSQQFELKIDAFLIVSDTFKSTPAYKGDEADGYFKEMHIDFSDDNAIRKAIEPLNSYDRVITHCIAESAMSDYAKIIPYLKNGTLTQSPESLQLSSQKSMMRKAMKAHFPEISPKFVILQNYSDLSEDKLSDFAYPLIIKPNGLSSSYLVEKCKDYNEVVINVKNAFSKIDELYKREHGAGEKTVVVEEFIEGELFSIDSYVDNDGTVYHLPPVRVITSHDVGLGGFYGYERIVPAPNLNSEEIAAAQLCVEKTIKSLGLYNSTAHVELYKTSHGWKTVELGPRIGGYRHEIYKEAYGIDHFYNDVLLHFGKKPVINHDFKKFVIAINIYPDKEGVIDEIRGFEEAQKLSTVFMLKQHASAGSYANFAMNGGKYIVDGIFSGISREQVENDVQSARQLITIDVKR